MEAVKENKCYTITESDIDAFVKEGYDIYEGGKCIAYGAGKTVPYAKYKKVEQYAENLQREIIALKAEIEALSKKKSKKKEEE